MKLSVSSSAPRRARAGARSLAIVVVASTALVAGGPAHAATPPPPLGTATSFALLAGSTITNTGATAVTGDVGLHPGTSITNTGTFTVSGTTHATDAVALDAKNDLVTAYDAAAAAAPTAAVVADLGGQTLVPGVYHADSSIDLTGALTLDAEGDPSAVFIFQTGSTLITGSASSVVLARGAQACNVFWQVGSSATLGTGSTFRGSILADEAITFTTGATLEGRAFAQVAAVTLDTNTITRPDCTIADAAAAANAAAAAAAQAAADAAAAAASAAARNQVTQVPVGAVSTGDGSTITASDDGGAALLGLVLLGAVGALTVVVRRRRVGA